MKNHQNESNESKEINKSKDSSIGQGSSPQPSANAAQNSGREVSTKKGNGESTTYNGKDTSTTLVDQAKSTATDAYAKVADKASTAVEDQKLGLAVGLSGAADTVRRVSGTIGEAETQNIITEYAAKYTETAAQKLESAAQYFERTDLRGFARDAEGYARRNPAIFLGAAFAIGVLAARFIKSPPPSVASAGAATERQPNTNGKWKNSDLAAKSAAM